MKINLSRLKTKKFLATGACIIFVLVAVWLWMWLLWGPTDGLDDQKRATAKDAAYQFCQNKYKDIGDCDAMKSGGVDVQTDGPTDGYNTYHGTFIFYYEVLMPNKDRELIAVSLHKSGNVLYVTDSGYLEYPACPTELKLPQGQCKGLPKMEYEYTPND